MMDYAMYHFKFEEEYLYNMGYPGIVEHARTHKDFDTRIYQFFREFHDGNTVLNSETEQAPLLLRETVLNSELLKMIKNWLLDHILVEDKKYSLFSSDH